jgi:hypothetical protein
LSSLHASNFLDDCEICYDFKAVEPRLLVKENYIIISDPFKHD